MKLCCVDNCKTGTYQDRERRKKDGVRILSLFKAPKVSL